MSTTVVSIDKTNTIRETYTLAQVFGYLSETNSRICSDARLFIIRRTRQELQQVAIDRAVGELPNDCQYSLDSLFSNGGCNIRESRRL